MSPTAFFVKKIHAEFTADRELRRLINEHAESCARLRATTYQSRYYATSTKLETDIIRGKLAEWAVYSWLQIVRPNVSQPDMELYTDSQMNELRHAPDLVADGTRFGVKACKMSDKDPSWVFQKTDPVNDNLYFFSQVDEEFGYGKVKLSWLVSADVVRDLAAPLRNNAPSKFAVYDKHLVETQGETS